jgi:MFS transporter, VNT family, synaptic vesicle glycoprotein 2
MVWFPELFNRFEEFEELYPNATASVCEVSSVNIKSSGEEIFCGEPIKESVYIHTLIIGLACIPTSLLLPLCVHRLGAKFFLSKYSDIVVLLWRI